MSIKVFLTCCATCIFEKLNDSAWLEIEGLLVGASPLAESLWCVLEQDPSRYDWKIVDWDIKNQNKQDKKCLGLLPLSPPGSIFQIITCLIWALWVHVTYLFIECVTKSCYPPDWLIQTCYQSASSRVTENTFLTQKCFSVENLIIVSLNTVLPIIVIV